MSTTFITPATLAQAEWHLEASGITDLVCPPRPPGRRGRIGMIRNNTYLLLLAWVLCTMLGLETTLQKAHDVLTMNLTREDLVHPGFPGDSGPWIPGSLVVLSCAA